MKGSFFEAGVEGINDLTSTGKNKILEGDVFATSYGTNKLTLDTTASYLQGNIISEKKSKNDAPYGANNITISNGAT